MIAVNHHRHVVALHHFKKAHHVAVRGFPISCTGEGKAAYGWQRDGGHAEYL
ncbi:hypothetical protein EC971742_3029, partial [Escherichia coli 97.1742]